MSETKELFIENFPMQFEAYCNDTKLYGKRVREERERIGNERGKTYTVRELASDLGVTHSTITKIENGQLHKINIDYLNIMSNIFNCSYLYLLGKSCYRTASTSNYCFPNPKNNTELLKKLIPLNGPFYINNKPALLLNCIIDTIIHEARSNKKGITIENETTKYKAYYFLKKDLTKRKNSNTLTRAENYHEMMAENYRNAYLQFEKELYENNSIYDIIIIQDCIEHDDMIRFTEPQKDDNTLYLVKLHDLFLDNTIRVKNYNLLDFLYAIRNIDKINNSDVLRHFVKIFRKDDLCEDDIYSLIQIIINFYDADSDKRRNMLTSSYN